MIRRFHSRSHTPALSGAVRASTRIRLAIIATTFLGLTYAVTSNDVQAWQAESVDSSPAAENQPRIVINEGPRSLDLQEMLRAGGIVGYLIVILSLIMLALIVDHILNIRRSTIMPPGLAEEVHEAIRGKDFEGAKKRCVENPGFLSRVLHAGLEEVGIGYSTIEKSMEDAAVEQSARLFRRIEYLSVIGTLAPMLGLMGTVWGMIQAFLEFEQKANPQVSELAPGIYRALITTLLGLGVAVPSLAAFAVFRNRIDELAAEASLLAEHVFADYRRALQTKRQSATGRKPLA